MGHLGDVLAFRLITLAAYLLLPLWTDALYHALSESVVLQSVDCSDDVSAAPAAVLLT